MGLDVCAYFGLNKVDKPEVEDVEETGEYKRFWENPNFPGRSAGIECGDTVYSYTDAREVFSGGYGRYNRFRNTLARVAGYGVGSYQEFGRTYESYAATVWAATEGPFWEQINFSDCEGTIGPLVCAKLARDYSDFQHAVDAYTGEDAEEFKATYAEWREAIGLAANNGALVFS